MSNCAWSADKKKQNKTKQKRQVDQFREDKQSQRRGKKDKCCELNQQSLINTIKLGIIEMET